MGLYTEYTIDGPSLSTFKGVMDSLLNSLHRCGGLGSDKNVVYIETDNCHPIFVIANKYAAVYINGKETYYTNSYSESLIPQSG